MTIFALTINISGVGGGVNGCLDQKYVRIGEQVDNAASNWCQMWQEACV